MTTGVTGRLRRKIRLAKDAKDDKNALRLEHRYNELTEVLEQRPRDVTYINIKDPQNDGLYFRINQDIVFVLVPDEIHVKYARDWLKRAVLVVVEKPYNRDLVEAQMFEQILADMVRVNGQFHPVTWVVCIDHYLGKIFEFVLHRDEAALIRQLGVIQRIEFSICESRPVEPWRATSLEAGMVYDLFCHLLAQISPFVNLKTFLQQEPAQCHISVAQHENCPIAAESFAYISCDNLYDYHSRPIQLTGSLGKGIGEADNKFLRLVGQRTSVYADFAPHSDGQICFVDGTHKSPLYNIGNGHHEMLEAIFKGRFIEEPVGGLTGEIAIQILQILTSIRSRIEQHRAQLATCRYPVEEGVSGIIDKALKL